MTDLEAIQQLRELYKKTETKAQYITSFVVTEGLLNQMINTCDYTLHMEERTDWYDDENGNYNVHTWTDVDGEGYGWAWLKERDDSSKWHEILRNSMMDYIDIKKDGLNENNKQYVLIVYVDDRIIYHFIERESSMSDTIFTFSDSEIVF